VTGTRDNRKLSIFFTDGNFNVVRRHDTRMPASAYGNYINGVHVEDWDGNGGPDVLFGERGGKVGIAY